MRNLRGRAPELVIALAVLICFVAVGWLDYSNQRRQAATYDSFSSFDYQHGGYRAWFEMLRDEGIRLARYERRPAYLSDSVATLVLANNAFDAELRQEFGQPSGVYSDADLLALAQWVKRGGRLVWLVDEATSLAPSTAKGSLRSAIDLVSQDPLHLPVVANVGSEKDAALAIAPSPFTQGVKAVSGSSGLRVPFDKNFSLSPLVADRSGIVVGWYPLGKGSVIVVTDETLFENGKLAQADNARLGYNLATYALQPGQTVAFEEWSHGYQSGDTWWAILPQPFRVAFGIAGIALLLLLFGATWRFGPAVPLPENNERTSFEYLTSMAGLLERGRAARKAVRDLAHLALHASARSVGLPDAATASAIAERLRGTNAGERRADDVVMLERLAGYENPSSAELVEAAQLALSLRKEFSLDGFQRIEPRHSTQRRSA